MNRELLSVLGGLAVAASGSLPLRITGGTIGPVPFEASVHAGTPVVVVGGIVIIAGVAAAGGLLRPTRAAAVAAVATIVAVGLSLLAALSLGIEELDHGRLVETTSVPVGAGMLTLLLGVVFVATYVVVTLRSRTGRAARGA